MLKLHIAGRELFDDDAQEFFTIDGCDLLLEHSLVSISKWESKYHKSFFNTKDKTAEEAIDYIRMMVVGKEPKDKDVFYLLTQDQCEQIKRYIDDPMTATVFSKEDEAKATTARVNGKFVSSEEVYYWMTAQNIPFECQHWHINRLITLIKICAIKNKPEDNKKNKRMTSSELANRRARMEAARKKFGG